MLRRWKDGRDDIKNDNINKDGKVTGLFKGIPSVSFTKEDISELSSRFSLALVAKFIRRPSFTTMNKFLQKLGLKGGFDISLLHSNSFLLNFREEDDYLRLFLRRSWQVFDKQMSLTKWSPWLSQESENPIMPIWIAFPGLPIHLHDKRALHLIASTIGTPQKVDSCTMNFSRPALARCCVEVDISNLPPARILINHGGEELIFPFHYEDVPLFCKRCKRTGHVLEACQHKKEAGFTPYRRTEVAPEKMGELAVDLTSEKWQKVKSKKGKAKMPLEPALKREWRARPSTTSHATSSAAWKEGPGESSKTNAGTSDPIPTLNSVLNNGANEVISKNRQGAYCITDPLVLSALTLQHCSDFVVRSPILFEAPTFNEESVDVDDSLALVPFVDFNLRVDGEPEVGFFDDPQKLNDSIHRLDSLLNLNEFPPLPTKEVSPSITPTPRTKERHHAMVTRFMASNSFSPLISP
ncbi:unnamed protein product [Cuscuta campestris]|uniref:DUF4283 domain-containing protein n=1 Tax=Cuscuta campestris TaxID=132261 RepID=A0A484N422_9ASTE|nr:unnamed protein product [Cuscuta campestris]